MDVHEAWVSSLPSTPALRVAYLVLAIVGMGFGIALSNHCKLPIIPTDLFSRELALFFHWPYRRVKTTFDLICLAVTLTLSLVFFRDLKGLGVGTVLCAFVMGSIISRFDRFLDRHFRFVSFLEPSLEEKAAQGTAG